MSRKTVITVAITFVATTILWVGVIGGFYWFYYGNEPPFRVVLNHPAEVALGSEFTVAVAVEISSDEPAVSLASARPMRSPAPAMGDGVHTTPMAFGSI